MAAVSMVVGESDDLQLGFPSAYQSQYAAKKLPLRAFPSPAEPRAEILAGDDFQAQWHQQKKRDADYMSSAKVQSTINANKRSNNAAHGYFGMPKPLLGQRVFANPSNESRDLNSARQLYASAPFHYSDSHGSGSGSGGGLTGGVLRSAAGQTYAKKLLSGRVGQLDRINENSVQFSLMNQMGVPGSEMAAAPTFTKGSLTPESIGGPISLTVGLQRVVDLLVGTDIMNNQESGFRNVDEVYKETRSAIGPVLAIGATAPASVLSDTLGVVQRIEGLMNDLLDTDRDDPFMDEYANRTSQASLLTLQEIYRKLNSYLTEMIAKADLQPRDRQTLARSLIKSLGFSKSLDVAVGRSRDALALVAREGTPSARQLAQTIGSRGSFSTDRGSRREDTEHGSRRSGASDDGWGDSNRSEFGWRSGEYFPTNGRSVGWFGSNEDVVSYQGAPEEGAEFERQSQAPSSLSGRQSMDISLAPSRASTMSSRTSASTARAQSEAPVRGFFDPDTQAFNVGMPAPARAQSVASRRTAASAASRRSAPRRQPAARVSPAQSVASRRTAASVEPARRAAISAMLKATPRGSPASSVGSRRSSGSEPRRRSSNPRAVASSSPRAAAVDIPRDTAQLPNTVEALATVVRNLRAQGLKMTGVSGTVYDPGTAGFKQYITNTKARIVREANAGR